MQKRDLLWILAFPIYYLINSFRHELAHASSALLEGAQVLALSFWPDLSSPGQIFWGGAAWEGSTTWLTNASPYIFDLLTFLAFFYICMAVPFQQRWMWLNLVIIGLVSPLLNSGYNFLFLSDDIRVLLQMFSPTVLDIYFLATMAFYLIGLAIVFTFSRTSLPSVPEATLE